MLGYTVIYADCPWYYKDKALAGNRGAECKYPVMTPEQLWALPIREISADDSLCFMWATMPQLNVALTTMNHWGFVYKTVAFTWIKTTKHGNLAWGMGRWTRANAEVVLLGTKGKPKRINAGVHSVIVAPRGPHSAKPVEVRERIVKLVGDVPRIELFSREAATGWHRWGYDAPEGEGHIADLAWGRDEDAAERWLHLRDSDGPAIRSGLPEARQESSQAENLKRQGPFYCVVARSVSSDEGLITSDSVLPLAHTGSI